MRSRLWSGAAALALAVACTPAPPASEPVADDTEKRATLDEMVAQVRERYPTVKGVTADQVKVLVETSDPVLVDVRPEAERRVSVIPGAIPAEEFEADPTRFVGRTVVAYCTVGERSARFAARMADDGVEVLNFEGSLLAWTHANGPLVDADGPTDRIHVYGPTWNLAADGYEAIW